MRGYLEYLARKMGFDPLISENWYNVPRQEFTQHWPVRRYMDKHHAGSWAKALVSLFPELNLEISRFSSTHKFWNSVQNRRELFERFARAQGGDPLDPKFWYSLRIKEFLCKKGYTDSVMHVFPELRLSRNKFKPLKVYRWKDADQKKPIRAHSARPHRKSKKRQARKYTRKIDRRAFFEVFAQKHGFDPLTPENWYSVSRVSLSKNPGYNAILGHYDGKLADCLVHLFPNIGLNKSYFLMPIRDRRSFFDKFALAQGFDPLVPDNWYSVSSYSLSQHQDFKTILQYYKGELSDCLVHLYPNIGLQKLKFPKLRMRNRDREFLDNFATEQGFDPLIPENWYNAFSQYHDYKVLLKYFRGKLSDCLLQLYPDIGLQRSKFNRI
eukprot:Phypoly_transcript_10653.p1 GENE.Phypoly_transcript_10653~~Phypoly_transcript_10653.p1  ORF type:complete len:428 (-),score=54.41 Phypoly_transcript_10653:8-1153(-)